jgi:hypothetical protein
MSEKFKIKNKTFNWVFEKSENLNLMTSVIFLAGFLFENMIILKISFGIKCVNYAEWNLNEEQWQF